MTPAEFAEAVRGFTARQDAAWYRIAWQVSHGYAPHMKRGHRAPSPEKLLGRVTQSGSSRGDTPPAEDAS